MTNMKKYYGIILSVIYALAFRILVEFGLLEINSWTYLIFVPVVVGYLPFMLDKKAFIRSKTKAILFPVISVFAFLVLAFVSRLEDLGCFIILLPPYLLISALVSLNLRTFLHDDSSDAKPNVKNSLIFFVLPLIVGHVEKSIEKQDFKFEVTQKITINCPKEKIWDDLFSVPDLTNEIDQTAYNYLGFPNPEKSVYDPGTKVRLGYFSNGIVLHEKVSEIRNLEKLAFTIDIEKSAFGQSQTFRHVLQSKSLVFHSIVYELRSIGKDKTELSLHCDYNIKTNIPFYGEFWSKNIISDFEQKLLKALKKQQERKNKSI